MNRETVFSPCRRYRYTLWREFYSVLAEDPPLLPVDGNAAHNYVQFIGLKPSTADETQDDPTIRRCIGFAKAWGFGAMCMTNLFAFRATDPNDMMANAGEVPVFSRENAQWIAEIATGAGLIICAWGNHGSHLSRGKKVLDHLRGEMKLQLHHLGLTGTGQPKHPLYLKKDLKPIPFA